MARSGVDPNIECVVTACEFFGTWPVAGEGDTVEDFGGGLFEPKVSSRHSDFLRNCPNDVGIHVGAAVFIVECWNRDAPCALATDAPIGTILHSCANTIFPPVGDKIDIFERFQGSSSITVLIESDEPLVHCTKDDGRFGAPAMRIAVDKFLFGN